jgi:orotidine-5'-phosphate decarboxylase
MFGSTVQDYIRNPLILSLDVDRVEEAKSIMGLVGSKVGCVKLGPRLVLREPNIVQEFSKQAPVFLDFKFFDITSTMVASVEAAFEMGATFVTVHAVSGHEALRALAELESKLNQKRPFKVLAVTVLTSWNESSLPPNFEKTPVSTQVEKLAQLVLESGLSGIVCSPMELELLRSYPLLKITPGIRGAGDLQGDQKRTMTAAQAIDAGADGLVIGRPILQASNRLQAIEKFLLEISPVTM